MRTIDPPGKRSYVLRCPRAGCEASMVANAEEGSHCTPGKIRFSCPYCRADIEVPR